MVKRWRERLTEGSPLFAPVEVKSGPVQQNVMTGGDINLWKFPAAKWHEFDGGRYIGTGSVIITRDPDTGYINFGCNRVQVHDKTTANVHVERANRYTYSIMQKYWAKGQSCPAAVLCGSDPRMVVVAGSTLASAHAEPSEYYWVGWLRKNPVEIIKGRTVDLPIPASSEIVLEGHIGPPGVDDRVEGPFGEGKGVYDGGLVESVLRVSCVMHRDDPIILGCPPLCGDYELRYGMQILKSASVWNELDKRISGVEGVWVMNEARDPIIVVSLKQQYAGHAKDAALNVAACYSTRLSPQPSRFVIIVDDDIDPSNLSQVMLAIGTRCNPEDGIDIIRGLRCGIYDTPLSPEKKRIGDITLGKCFIYACKPYSWIKEFPRLNKYSPQQLEEASRKWGHLIFGV